MVSTSSLENCKKLIISIFKCSNKLKISIFKCSKIQILRTFAFDLKVASKPFSKKLAMTIKNAFSNAHNIHFSSNDRFKTIFKKIHVTNLNLDGVEGCVLFSQKTVSASSLKNYKKTTKNYKKIPFETLRSPFWALRSLKTFLKKVPMTKFWFI